MVSSSDMLSSLGVSSHIVSQACLVHLTSLAFLVPLACLVDFARPAQQDDLAYLATLCF